MLAFIQGEVPLPDARDQEIVWIILGVALLACVIWVFLYPYAVEAWEDLKNELKNLRN